MVLTRLQALTEMRVTSLSLSGPSACLAVPGSVFRGDQLLPCFSSFNPAVFFNRADVSSLPMVLVY